MPNPVQPTILKSGSTALTSGGSLSNRDLYEFGMTVLGLNTQDMPPIKPRRVARAGAHGQYIFEEFYDSRPLVMSGQMQADTIADLRTNIAAAKSFLNTFRRSQPRRLRLVDPQLSDRYFLCHYDGEALFGEPAPRLAGTIIDFSVRLLAEPPFALATDLSEDSYSAPAGTFRSITTGTFASDPMIILKGAATNPKVVFGDSIFIATFDMTTDFTDVYGATSTGTFSGSAAQKAALWSPSSIGLGHSFLASGAYTLSWAVTGNKDAGTWFMVVEPQFDSTESGTKTILTHRYGANDYVALYYVNGSGSDAFDRRFVFVKYCSGTASYVATSVQNFVSGDALKLAVSYDTSGGMKIYLAGALEEQNGVVTAMAGNPATLYLHAYGANFSANMKIHYLAGWSSQLTDNEQALVSADPTEVAVNRNQVLLWTGVLDAGDWLEFNRQDGRWQGRRMDVSAGSLTTGVFPDNGYVIPELAADNTAIYHPTAVDTVYLQWRNRYL